MPRDDRPRAGAPGAPLVGSAAIASAPVARARAARVLVVGLAALLVARAALALAPWRAAWSLDLMRFTAPGVAWATWLAAALALAPAVRRRCGALAMRLGDAIVSAPAARWGAALILAALVLALPDQARMTGDFLLRQRAIEENRLPSAMFPQALPLDVWLHHTAPRFLFVHLKLAPNLVARVWGALDAALLAWAAVACARAWRFAGGAALAAAGAIAWSGALALCTGYGKGLADLTVLVAVVAALGARVAAEGRGRIALGVAAALAVALHRAGALLAPAALLAWAIDARARGVSRGTIAGAALLLAAAAVHAARVTQIATGFDAANHLRAGWTALRLADVANALVLTAPLAPLAPALALGFGRALPRRAAAAPAAALALALLPLALAVVPQQGIVRDWDVFAPAGMALAVVTAWLVGEALRDDGPAPVAHAHARAAESTAPARHAALAGGVALAVVLGAAAPATQWLAHLHDTGRALARVAALIAGPPRRDPVERARLWDYVGIRRSWLDDWPGAAEAFERSAALLPTPRVMDQWGRALLRIGDWDGAKGVYETLLARDPDHLSVWRSYATAATRVPDWDASRRAAENILRLDPTDRDAKEILEYLARRGSTARDTVRR